MQFLFKAFVNTIGTFGSKSPENKGLILTCEKISRKSVHREKNPCKSSVHIAERNFRNIQIFEKKHSGNTGYHGVVING